MDSVSLSLKNGQRIVSCVNACRGINPEAVPELLEACEEIQNTLIDINIPDYKAALEVWASFVNSTVSAALAKAKGEND